MPVTIEQARRAKEALRKRLEGREGVAGFGITKVGDDYAVKVNCEREPLEPLPPMLHGVLVQIEVVGKIRKRK